jgi:hypothetical protein
VADAPVVLLSNPWIRFGKRRVAGRPASIRRFSCDSSDGPEGLLTAGTIELPDRSIVSWARVFTVVPNQPYVYVDMAITYPETEHVRWSRRKAERLGRTWDARRHEVAPLELEPAVGSTVQDPALIVKHNYQNHVPCYELNYHEFSENRQLDCFNNHITDGWVAVTGPYGGLLLAQSAAFDNSFAFCPMRTRMMGETQRVLLNPFGTYTGRQLRYHTARTGLGRTMALLMADQLDSYAPSYEGRSSYFSLMIAPFRETSPPLTVQRDALLFATPPIAVRNRAAR